MRRAILILALGGVLSAPVGWGVTDYLERDNRFCGACHLPDGSQLHAGKLSTFAVRDAPTNLAAAHAAAESGFRCIDCHGGASFPNKLRVKTVAARDAALWVIGRFGEPERMNHPLWDEDCRQCHGSYRSRRDDDFHAIADHNGFDFAYRCVECHLSHPSDGEAAFAFLAREQVLPVCRNCHEEF